MINELTVWIAAYPLLTFTTWLDPYDTEDKVRKDEAGWFIVGCLAFNVLFNFTLLIVSVIYSFYHKFKLLWIRWSNRLRYQKMVEERERARNEQIRLEEEEKMRISE